MPGSSWPLVSLPHDQDTATGRRLARGRVRTDVLRQERGADPPPAPRRDRRPARPDREAAARRPLRRRSRRLARGCQDAGRHCRVERRGTPPRSRLRRGGDRRGAVLRRRDRRRDRRPGRGGRARRRGGAGAGLPRVAVRRHADAALRCRVRRQARGCVPPLRRAGDDDAASRRRRTRAVRRCDDPGRSARFIRGALPRVLRAGCAPWPGVPGRR